MNAETSNTLAEAFREHRDAFGVSITFGVTAITALVGESPFSRDLTEGGFADSGTLKTKILLADLPTLPPIGSLVTYQDRAYKVSTQALQPGGQIGEFELRPAHR